MDIKLSICIPTYNFGSFIGQTLDCILPQMTSEVELVVLDSNSQDQTEMICTRFHIENPQINFRYFKAEKKQGIDRDIESVVNLSKGEYVWLFSADDILLPESLNKIFSGFHSNHDIYLSEHIMCDLNMNRIKPHPIFNNIAPGTEFNFSEEKSRLHYLSSARTTEAFFSFLSTPIFKRTIWDRVPTLPEVFYKTCWALAGRLLLSSKQGLTIKYLGDQLLLKRGDNDSFLDKGRVNRIGIAIEGYDVIATGVFGRESMEAYHIRRVLRFDLPLKLIMVTKLFAYRNPQAENLDRLDKMIRLHYFDFCPSTLLNKFVYNFSNPWLLELIYVTTRFGKRRLGRLRNT